MKVRRGERNNGDVVCTILLKTSYGMKASLPLRGHIWFQRTILLKTSYGMKERFVSIFINFDAYNTFKNQLWDERFGDNSGFAKIQGVQYF